MIYNNDTKKAKTATDCLTCPYFDAKGKRCNGGLGTRCFEFDYKTNTIIDPRTKLPIKLN